MGLNISGLVIANNYNNNLDELAKDLSWTITKPKEISYDDVLSSRIPKDEYRVYFSDKGTLILSCNDLIEEDNRAASADSMNFIYSETAMHFLFDFQKLDGSRRVLYDAEREIKTDQGKKLPLEQGFEYTEEIIDSLFDSFIGHSILDGDYEAKCYAFKRKSFDPLQQHLNYIKINKVKSLDLHKFQLKTFPEEILKFDWLEELYFGFYYNNQNVSRIKACELKSIPEEISNLKNLKRLSLSGDVFGKTKPTIKDFSPLRHLTNLELLALNKTSLKDLDFLSNLTSLKHLQIEGTTVSDYNNIKLLENLNVLYLGDNDLIELNFLEGTTQIKNINLSGNNIKSLKPLTDNLELGKICFCNNGDHLKSELKSLPSLNEICVSGGIAFKDIEDNINLERIELEDITQSDINKLSSFKKLERLDIDYLEDELKLPELSNIKKLSVGGNVKSISGFENCPKLDEFTSYSRKLNHLPFPDNHNLKDVVVVNSNLKDLNEIGKLNRLEKLNIIKTKISSLKPLEGMLQLKKLSIQGSKVSSLEPILDLLHNKFNLELTHSPPPSWAPTRTMPPMPSELPEELISRFNEDGIQGVLDYYDENT